MCCIYGLQCITAILCLKRFHLISHQLKNSHRIPISSWGLITLPIPVAHPGNSHGNPHTRGSPGEQWRYGLLSSTTGTKTVEMVLRFSTPAAQMNGSPMSATAGCQSRRAFTVCVGTDVMGSLMSRSVAWEISTPWIVTWSGKLPRNSVTFGGGLPPVTSQSIL